MPEIKPVLVPISTLKNGEKFKFYLSNSMYFVATVTAIGQGGVRVTINDRPVDLCGTNYVEKVEE